MKELVSIQSELKAPKGQFNKFGNYRYRSAEDILEAVKPLLSANSSTLTISDEMVNLGNRYYVKATATLTNSDGQIVEVSAYAREEESKKGMDGAQITGSASSYARKYALNGLFCIDDTKDPNATNKHEKTDSYADLEGCSSVADLKKVWESNPDLHGVKKFRDLVNAKKQQLS